MKKRFIAIAAIAALSIAPGVFAAGKSSVEKGKELFNDPKLSKSTNESSCNSCHAEGKDLENAGANKKFTKLVNNCLVDRMEGEKLDGRSVTMRSLKMYIKSLTD